MLARQLKRRLLETTSEDAAAKEPRQPPRKLVRRAPTAASRPASVELKVRDSALFHPARALGVVTDGLPFAHASLGTADFVTVSAGHGFHVFECEHLRLAYIGPKLRTKIRHLLCVGEVVLTALQDEIVAWHKLIELGRCRGHTDVITMMCVIGSAYLVSSSDNEVLVWPLSKLGLEPTDAKRAQCILSSLGSLDVGKVFGKCTAACHPATYMHKVMLASESGHLQLWNVRTFERIHVFRAHESDGQKNGAITCMRDAPNVLDLVALGFATGRICMINAREDSVLFNFEQVQGRITALTFRTGSGAPAQLISGTPAGSFVVWDLEKRRMHHVQEEAHRGPVTAASFLPGQPLLMTSGRDNALRMWIFDTPDGLPRLLRMRSGCPGPAKRMRFYGGDNDRELIVAGRCGDRNGFVAKVSFIQDQQNKEYSQSSLQKCPGFEHLSKQGLPPVVDLAVCEVRHYDWPAIVTAHEQTDAAMVWSALHQALAPKVMTPESARDRAPVTAVAISPCGNYCVLGLENGGLHRFNLQSQLYRGTIPRRPGDSELSEKQKAKLPIVRAHKGRVCGVEITVGAQVLSVASHPGDCCLRTWKLMTHEEGVSIPLGEELSGTPSCLLLRAHGALAAVALDDGSLLVVDLCGASVVRTFACGMPAVDAAFSVEGRWLAAALRGGGLRVFDLPAARCVDSMAFARPAQCLCFSPSTAFLLISHAKGNSIQVWANKFLFDPSLSAPLLNAEPEEPVRVDELEEDGLDGADTGVETLAGADAGKPTGDAADDVALTVSVKPLEPKLLTLSDVPPAKWQATLHLDVVKERNKAIEPPKPLPNAPFFLPTMHEGVTPRFAAPADGEGDGKDVAGGDGAQRRAERSLGAVALPFQEMMRKGDFDGALEFLRAQTPSGVHLAIEELGPMAQGDLQELVAGLQFFEHHMSKAHFADELQAFLSLFLQAHGEELATESQLRERCLKLGQAQERLWTSLDLRCQKVRCFLGTLTQTQSQW